MKGYLRAINEKEVFSLSEMKLFLQALDDLSEGKMYQKISFKIMLLAGVRLSELCGLKWEDVDFEKSLVHIRRNRIHGNGIGIYEKEPKTKTSTRDIPLPDSLIKDLKEWLEQYENIGEFKLVLDKLNNLIGCYSCWDYEEEE